MSIITITSIILTYSSHDNNVIPPEMAKEIVNKLYTILTGINYCHCIIPLYNNNGYISRDHNTIEWNDVNIQYKKEFEQEIIDCIYSYTFTKKTNKYFVVSTVYEISIQW